MAIDGTNKRASGVNRQSNIPRRPACHHDKYYFADGSLVILVENVLFRVLRSSLTQCSAVFKDVLSLPAAGPAGFTEGSCDENPFILDGIESVDFERFLSIIYPSRFDQHDLTTVPEWLSILELAARWDVPSMRTLAIQQVEALLDSNSSPVDRVVISQRYRINDIWSHSAYKALCNRPKPLSVEEAARLGVETSTRISNVREQFLKRQVGGRRGSISANNAGGRVETKGGKGGVVGGTNGATKPSTRPPTRLGARTPDSDSGRGAGTRSRAGSVNAGRQVGHPDDRLPSWALLQLNIGGGPRQNNREQVNRHGSV